MLTACLAACISGTAFAEDSTKGAIRPLSSVKFSQDQDVNCLSSAVETGDPATGRSTLVLQASPGCVVPWHFHTAEEQLIVISGKVLSEMTDHPPTRLGPGGFAVMASHMPHQFTCQAKSAQAKSAQAKSAQAKSAQAKSACLMIVAFDRAYDIYWGKGR